MINTMRLKQLYTILLLCCVNICFAQNKLFDENEPEVSLFDVQR